MNNSDTETYVIDFADLLHELDLDTQETMQKLYEYLYDQHGCTFDQAEQLVNKAVLVSHV